MSRALAGVASAAGAACLLAGAASPALAHGTITGAQDVVADYGGLLFLLAIVLIGAGVLAWVILSPQPDDVTDPTDPAAPGAAAAPDDRPD